MVELAGAPAATAWAKAPCAAATSAAEAPGSTTTVFDAAVRVAATPMLDISSPRAFRCSTNSFDRLFGLALSDMGVSGWHASGACCISSWS